MAPSRPLVGHRARAEDANGDGCPSLTTQRYPSVAHRCAAGGVRRGLRCARSDDQLDGARLDSRREAGKRRLATNEGQRPRERMKRDGDDG